MGDWGATHVIFWHKNGDEYEVGASYVVPERIAALKAARGDDKSYTSESYAFKLDANGTGPVATAARSGVTQFVEDPASEPISGVEHLPLNSRLVTATLHHAGMAYLSTEPAKFEIE